MITAYHAIFTTYGTWLPNDPRGSYSKEIYNSRLLMLGQIKYGKQKPSPQKDSLMSFWKTATPQLKRSPFFINDRSRPAIAASFGTVVERLNIRVAACAIMNDHVHILVLRSKYRIEYTINQLKGAATLTLKMKQTPWSRGCWKVFINDTKTLQAAVDYINANPAYSGLVAQDWDFISPLQV